MRSSPLNPLPLNFITFHKQKTFDFLSSCHFMQLHYSDNELKWSLLIEQNWNTKIDYAQLSKLSKMILNIEKWFTVSKQIRMSNLQMDMTSKLDIFLSYVYPNTLQMTRKYLKVTWHESWKCHGILWRWPPTKYICSVNVQFFCFLKGYTYNWIYQSITILYYYIVYLWLIFLFLFTFW